ncbi:MAG: hypothetical protein JEZ14_16465 [Marinilabiliaceae bacterium]|nr:hypothetical protein [Marinilabiliaceae bacterium]
MKEPDTFMTARDAVMDICVTVMEGSDGKKVTCAVKKDDRTPIMEGMVMDGKVCVSR